MLGSLSGQGSLLLASPPQSMDISANDDEKAAAPPPERAAATPLKEEAVTANAHNDLEQHQQLEQHEQHLAGARTKQVSALVQDAAELQVHTAILRVDGAACTIQQSFRCCIGKFFRSFSEVSMPPRATRFTVDTDFKTSAPTVLVHFFGWESPNLQTCAEVTRCFGPQISATFSCLQYRTWFLFLFQNG